MADLTGAYRVLLAELDELRQSLLGEIQKVDVQIAQVQRLMSMADPDSDTALTARQPGQASPPGEARREILALMADGEVWTPATMGRARGTHPNAAGTTLRKIADEPDSPIRALGGGRYILASSPKGDAQGSLPVDAGSDEPHSSDRPEGGGKHQMNRAEA